MSIQISVFDPESGNTTAHKFSHSPVRIGRDAVCELRLPFAFVSGLHALLHFDDLHAELTDPGSTNGILREGQRLPPRQALVITHTLTFTIGRFELSVLVGPSDALAVAAHPATNPAAITNSDVATFARVHALIRELRPLHDQMLRAREAFYHAHRSALEQLPPSDRELAQAMLAREFSLS